MNLTELSQIYLYPHTTKSSKNNEKRGYNMLYTAAKQFEKETKTSQEHLLSEIEKLIVKSTNND